MTTSSRLINYGVRPGKNIERKMMKDAFQRLYSFFPLTNYQYIGFGAKYFVDFIIFHKHLHIDKMISIEGDTNNRRRYEFNKPFGCISIEYGNSKDVIPRLDLSLPTIAWLDYDSRFNIEMLNDVTSMAEKLCSGSVFCLSYNSMVYSKEELKDQHGVIAKDAYRKKLTEIVGEDNIPPGFDERGWTNKDNFSKLLRKSITSRIEKVLTERNSTLDQSSKLKYKQFLYFEYADGQRMETIGFLFYTEEHSTFLGLCNFESFPFFRDGDDRFKIDTPNFTLKEIRYLMEKMPLDNSIELDKKVYAEKDILSFSKIYKYFPSFNEVEII